VTGLIDKVFLRLRYLILLGHTLDGDRWLGHRRARSDRKALHQAGAVKVRTS